MRDMDRLLLHVCCAPCSGAIIEKLCNEGAKPAVFFSNSNIAPESEYNLRLAECRRYCRKFDIEVFEDEYDHAGWLTAVKGYEREPERGERCLRCFRYRLERAARFAAGHGFTVLTTSLASSRWKDLGQVDQAGSFACGLFPNVEWWGQNWRKNGLQQRRSEIIREQDFYNQTFCGCEFSHHRL